MAEERPPVETTEGALESSRIVSGNAASDADRTCEYGESDQWPNERKPIFFTPEV